MQLLICDSIFRALPDEDQAISGYLVIKDGRIAEVAEGQPPRELLQTCTEVVDYRGSTLTPGLIDAHTHLVHGGSRENELALKLSGASYLDIHHAGGGIFSTVRATREAGREALKEKALTTLRRMLAHGTTTVEAKSGYGLNFAAELTCLEIQRELSSEQPIEISSTFMGAHATPEEFAGRSDDYLRFLEDEVLPEVKRRGLAEFVDIFCEQGIFGLEQTERHLLAAAELGFGLKMHADEIVPLGGAELAARLGCVSAEHLMAVSAQGIKDLARAGTVPVLLPATSFFLMKGIYAPARDFIAAGAAVALASDYNPGSSPTENLQQVMWQACYAYQLTPAEILRGVTLHAARAIRRETEIGSLEVGKQADITVFDAPNPAHILYHFGVNRVQAVWKKGVQVIG